jgi:hypothetical protein
MLSGKGEEPARSWAEFLDRVRQARQSLGPPLVVWFRGQAKATYNLVPSLLRHPKGIEKEQTLFGEFERSASHLFGKGKSDWEMLYDMQHYGIPTRLLDWTDILGIAVAFALYDNTADDFDSAIFLLDPIKLNALSGMTGIKRAPNDSEFGYKTVYWEGRPFDPDYPIAIDGALHNDRLRAQKGSFTVQGRASCSLDVLAPSVVRKVVLTADVKPEAREFLEYANLNAFSIYPDIVGMAQHLVRQHFGG